MQLQNSGTELDDLAISEFEETLLIELPEPYRNFMLQNNGGTPESELTFEFVDGDNGFTSGSTVAEFLVIYPFGEISLYNDIKISYDSMLEEEEISANYLPIAIDEVDNSILISVEGEDYGKIYYANHELIDTKTGISAINLIANSFTEFLNILKSNKQE